MITAERLREIVSYDPDTGLMRWRDARNGGAKVGAIVGSLNLKGYRTTRINCRPQIVHRLIWLYVYGEWPTGQIDHINGKRDDNRIANLRLATARQQGQNRALRSDNNSGVKGVCWHAKRRKWNATIKVFGKQISLGFFDKIQDAAVAYEKAAEKNFGEYASHISRGHNLEGVE